MGGASSDRLKSYVTNRIEQKAITALDTALQDYLLSVPSIQSLVFKGCSVVLKGFSFVQKHLDLYPDAYVFDFSVEGTITSSRAGPASIGAIQVIGSAEISKTDKMTLNNLRVDKVRLEEY